jgi:hypothetical protein
MRRWKRSVHQERRHQMRDHDDGVRDQPRRNSQIISLVVEREVDIFAFGRYCPTSAEKENHIAPRDYRALLETCWAKFEEYRRTAKRPSI